MQSPRPNYLYLIYVIAIAVTGVGLLLAQDIDTSGMSSPPDTTPYVRSVIPEDLIPLELEEYVGVFSAAFVRDVVVSNTDATLAATDTFGDTETSIAVNPANPNEIVISAFSGSWGANAPIWHSTDGGSTWTKRFTVPVPPGIAEAVGAPNDQTFDYGRGNRLSGTFLSLAPLNVYTGTTTNPANAASWNWLLVAGVTQRTNSFAINNTDQPWALVNRDPTTATQDNVYVAYDDFGISPRGMRVAVAQGTNPPNFTIDRLTGSGGTGGTNPGHRLATDPRSGFVYSLFQLFVGAGAGGSNRFNYNLNRSTDGGNTWTLNGSATGIVVTTADSNQPTPKFGGVNALLGGVLHAAVDPTNGDIYYVYGNRDAVTGNNRLAIRRLQTDGALNVVIGPELFVTGQVQAAIPSVAVANNGVIGVFYYTFNGIVSGFPQFTAHLALSTDQGATFTDRTLETFLSSAAASGNPTDAQRVLGDYMQMKAVGRTFYGAFTGNGVPFGRTTSNHDPIFFKQSANRAPVAICKSVTVSGGPTCTANASIDNGSFDPDGDPITITQSPPGPYPKGTTTVTLTVTDSFGASSTCTGTVTVVDTTPPVVTSSVATPLLWPPNHDLRNVGLAASATDNCTPNPAIAVQGIFSTEADLGPDADSNFSPDARNIGLGTLRLRSERPGDSNGRVYLNVVKATDGAGNVGISCNTVVVPLSQDPVAIAAVNAAAASAKAFCMANNGAPPAGYVPVGVGPVVGPKQ